jgi:hypothetical protein
VAPLAARLADVEFVTQQRFLHCSGVVGIRTRILVRLSCPSLEQLERALAGYRFDPEPALDRDRARLQVVPGIALGMDAERLLLPIRLDLHRVIIEDVGGEAQAESAGANQ